MKFECELKTTIHVEFLEPEKTLKFFTESDWKEAFFTFDSLEEVSDHISRYVATFDSLFGEINGSYTSYHSLEGFPNFVGGSEYNAFITGESEMGVISVRIVQELYNYDIYEISEGV